MLIWGFIFLATGIVFTIFILGTPLFIRAPKNQPTIIRIAGVALSFLILLSATFILFDQNYYADFERMVPVFRSVFITLAPVITVCIFLQILFIRSIRKSVLELKILLVGLILLGFILLGNFFFDTYIALLIRPNIQLVIAFGLYRSLLFSSLMIWFFYEIKQALKKKKNFIFQSMQILCGLIVLQSLAWIIFLVLEYRFNGLLSPQFGGMSNLDMNVRVIRIGFFCTFEILLSIYWVQHYSLNAIEEREKKEKIKQLLIEKDVLIENLSNSSVLIESGALSAGLAHELNQFLGRIELNVGEISQLMSQSALNPKDLQLPVENILKANHSAAKLIISLKNLFNRSGDGPSVCSVDGVVKDVVSLYQSRIQKSHIKIVVDLRVNNRQLIWESLFHQVVVNLLVNAIEALDASAQSNKMIHMQSRIDEQGHYCLTITDNGLAIDAQQGEKMFNLFATSKASGTGIGLWLSRYILERHKGSLTYRNLPENGGVSFIATIPTFIK